MPTKKNLSTYYLNSKGIGANGGKLAETTHILTADELRKEIANEIATRLSEGFAMIEVAKELGIFTDEYAEKVLNTAKDANNMREFRKAFFKTAIYKDINKALGKAGLPLVGEEGQQQEPEFE